MDVKYIRVICLANSRKLSGRCIAGKMISDTQPGRWIRPVSNRPMEEISEHERHYKDGADPKLLDLIDIPFLAPCPKPYQSENRLIEPNAYWKKAGTLTVPELHPYIDSPKSLWINGNSTLNGLNDRVTLEDASKLGGSLYLIEVPKLALRVSAPGAAFGNPKRRVKALFAYKLIQHHLSVTDPKIEREYLAKADGDYLLGAHYLTISLGEPLDGFCYKLIAAMIPKA